MRDRHGVDSSESEKVRPRDSGRAINLLLMALAGWPARRKTARPRMLLEWSGGVPTSKIVVLYVCVVCACTALELAGRLEGQGTQDTFGLLEGQSALLTLMVI